MKRRVNTLVLGAIPVVALASLVTLGHIPGTDIDLTVPYAAEGPGPTVNTLGDVDGKPVVNVSGAEIHKTTGNLNMTTVSVRTHLTLGQALGRWLIAHDTLVPIEQIFPQGKTPEEVDEVNKAAFSTSEASATIAAMNQLHKPVDTVVAHISPEAPAAKVMAEGDVITQVAGAKVTGPSQVRDSVRAKKPGETISIGFLRDGKQLTQEVTLGTHPEDDKVAFLGVSMTARPADGITVDYNLEDIGGPSAGLIFSLAVVDKLSPDEINGGKFVAGTGTIDDDGTVGPIGGIRHKVRAARDAGAQVFLSPEKNCSEALKGKPGDMVVISVDSLSDAIHQLDNFKAGKEVKTCS